MGAWGTYDDESDRTHDIIADLEEKLLPKRLKQQKTVLEKPCKPKRKGCVILYGSEDTDSARRAQQKWMAAHGPLVQRELNKMKDLLDSDISGVARYLAYGWGTGRKRAQSIPPMLRKRALQASQKELDQMKSGQNPRGWFDQEDRIRSLRSQIRLFSA